MDKKITNTFQGVSKSALKSLNRNFEANLVKDENRIDEIMSIFIGGELSSILSILNSGQILNFKDQTNQTLIHAILRNELPNISEEDKLDIIKKLVGEKNVSLHTMTNYNQNPLHLACQNGYKIIIDYMLKNNCDQTLIDNYGNAPIHYLVDKFVSECKENEFYSYINKEKKLLNSTELKKINKILRNESILLLFKLFEKNEYFNSDISSNGFKIINAIKNFISNKIQLSLPEIYNLIEEKINEINKIFIEIGIDEKTKFEKAKNIVFGINENIFKLYGLDMEFSNIIWSNFILEQNLRIESKKKEIKQKFLKKIENIKKFINEDISKFLLEEFMNKIYNNISRFTVGSFYFCELISKTFNDPNIVFIKNDKSGNLIELKNNAGVNLNLLPYKKNFKKIIDNFKKFIISDIVDEDLKVFLNGVGDINNIDFINIYICDFEEINHPYIFNLDRDGKLKKKYFYSVYEEINVEGDKNTYVYIPSELEYKNDINVSQVLLFEFLNKYNININRHSYTENSILKHHNDLDMNIFLKYSPIRIVVSFIEKIVIIIQNKLIELEQADEEEFKTSLEKFIIVDLKIITEFIIKIINNFVILEKYLNDIDIEKLNGTNENLLEFFTKMKNVGDNNFKTILSSFDFFIEQISLKDDLINLIRSKEYVEDFDKIYDHMSKLLHEIIDLTKSMNDYYAWDQLEKYNKLFGENINMETLEINTPINFSNTIFNDYFFEIKLPNTYKMYKEKYFKIKEEINLYKLGIEDLSTKHKKITIDDDELYILKLNEFITNPNYLTDFYSQSWKYTNTNEFNIFYFDKDDFDFEFNYITVKINSKTNLQNFYIEDLSYDVENLKFKENKFLFSRGYDLLKYNVEGDKKLIKDSDGNLVKGKKEKNELCDNKILSNYSDWDNTNKSVRENPDLVVTWGIEDYLKFDSIDNIESYIITKNLDELINLLVNIIYKKISNENISNLFFEKNKIQFINRNDNTDIVEEEIGIQLEGYGLDEKTITNINNSLSFIFANLEEREKYLYDNIKLFVKIIIYNEIYKHIFKIIDEIKITRPDGNKEQILKLKQIETFEKDLKIISNEFKNNFLKDKLYEFIIRLETSTTLEIQEIINMSKNNNVKNNEEKKIFGSICFEKNKTNELINLNLDYKVLDSNGNSILIRLIDQLNIYGIELLLKNKSILVTYKNFNQETPIDYLKKKIKTIQSDYTIDNFKYRLNKYSLALDNEIKSNKEFEEIEFNDSLNLITQSISNSIYLFNESMWLKVYSYPSGWTVSDKNKLKEILGFNLEKLLINTFGPDDISKYIEEKKIQTNAKINVYIDALNNDILELKNQLKEYEIELCDKDNIFTSSKDFDSNEKLNSIKIKIVEKEKIIKEYDNFLKDKLFKENYLEIKTKIEDNISDYKNKLLDMNTLTIKWDEYENLLDNLDSEYLEIIKILNYKCEKTYSISNHLLKIYSKEIFGDKDEEDKYSVFDLINKYFKLIFVKEYDEYMDLDKYDDSDYNTINKSIIEILKLNVVGLVRNELINTLAYYLIQLNKNISNSSNIIKKIKTDIDLKKSLEKFLYLSLINKLGLVNPDKVNLQINIDNQKNMIINTLDKLIGIGLDQEEKNQIEKIINFNDFICKNIGFNCYEEIVKILSDGKKISIYYQIYNLINKYN